MASEPHQLVLSALEARDCRPRPSGEGWSALCPAHEDRSPSLTVGIGDDGRALLTCHAGCRLSAILAALGLEMAQLWPEREEPGEVRKLARIVKTYDYEDAEYALRMQVCRRADKSFSQRRPNGNGGWVWSVRGVQPIPYHLPRLLEACARHEVVYVVEGEKDVEAVEAAGAVATCNPGGAGKWRPEFAEYLSGAAEVRIVADRDEAGYAHARQVAASLNGHAVLLEAAKGNDVSDHLAAGLPLAALRHVDDPSFEDEPEEEAPPLEEPEPEPPRRWAQPWSGFRDSTEPEVRWLVRSLIPQGGGFGVLGSTPKAGKTWGSAALALCLVTGKPYLGRFPVLLDVPVYYLALEGSRPGLRARIGALARGLGLDPDSHDLDGLHVAYKPADRVQLVSDQESAKRFCEDVLACEARVVIVDTTRRAARIRESGEGVEDIALLRANLAPLIEAGVFIHMLHHAHKLRTSEGQWEPPLERLSGSGDWGGLVEIGMVLDRKRSDDWRDMRFEVDARDAATLPIMRVLYEGEGSGPDGLLRYTDTLRVRCEDDEPVEEGERSGLDAAAAAAWLAQQPGVRATTTQLAQFLEVHRKTVENQRSRLARQGIAWTEQPQKGEPRYWWLSSPAYAAHRAEWEQA